MRRIRKRDVWNVNEEKLAFNRAIDLAQEALDEKGLFTLGEMYELLGYDMDPDDYQDYIWEAGDTISYEIVGSSLNFNCHLKED